MSTFQTDYARQMIESIHRENRTIKRSLEVRRGIVAKLTSYISLCGDKIDMQATLGNGSTIEEEYSSLLIGGTE